MAGKGYTYLNNHMDCINESIILQNTEFTPIMPTWLSKATSFETCLAFEDNLL